MRQRGCVKIALLILSSIATTRHGSSALAPTTAARAFLGGRSGSVGRGGASVTTRTRTAPAGAQSAALTVVRQWTGAGRRTVSPRLSEGNEEMNESAQPSSSDGSDEQRTERRDGGVAPSSKPAAAPAVAPPSRSSNKAAAAVICPDCDLCDGSGRIAGGLGAVLPWLPVKAYRPCPNFIDRGGTYQRSGQGLDEIAFGRDSTYSPK